MFCPPFRRPTSRPHVLTSLKMTESNFAEVLSKYEVLCNEYQACKRKLDSKCEALLILSRELDQCRSERDQFKLMAEQLRERYQALKRQLAGQAPLSPTHNILDPRFYSDMQNQSIARLLCDSKELNKSLQFEVDDLKQKLQDAQGDIKLLREQIARQRVGTMEEGITTRHFPAYEREDLVVQLEAAREQYEQLERDLQQVLDEKEEQETERDAYKMKYERLNSELNFILKGDERKVVDIDALIMENKYLQDRLKQMEEEKTMAMATVSKYKSMLERKKNKGILKLGQSRSGGLVITQKQVQQMLRSQSGLVASQQTVADLQALCGGLLETINDKSLALSHQRKTNKILGNRVAELEKKLKTLEVSGLWNVPGSLAGNLAKLRSECEEVKMLVPRTSQSSDASEPRIPDILDDLDTELSSTPSSSLNPSPHTSPSHNPHPSPGRSPRSPALNMEDLDLLPTKDSTGCGERMHTREAEADLTLARQSSNASEDVSDLDPCRSSPVLDVVQSTMTTEHNTSHNASHDTLRKVSHDLALEMPHDSLQDASHSMSPDASCDGTTIESDSNFELGTSDDHDQVPPEASPAADQLEEDECDVSDDVANEHQALMADATSKFHLSTTGRHAVTRKSTDPSKRKPQVPPDVRTASGEAEPGLGEVGGAGSGSHESQEPLLDPRSVPKQDQSSGSEVVM